VAVPAVVAVHEALRKSWPEPLARREVFARCGMPARRVDGALAALAAAGLAVRCRRLDGGQGYAYTVALFYQGDQTRFDAWSGEAPSGRSVKARGGDL
jgi:hypothetical protein